MMDLQPRQKQSCDWKDWFDKTNPEPVPGDRAVMTDLWLPAHYMAYTDGFLRSIWCAYGNYNEKDVKRQASAAQKAGSNIVEKT